MSSVPADLRGDKTSDGDTNWPRRGWWLEYIHRVGRRRGGTVRFVRLAAAFVSHPRLRRINLPCTTSTHHIYG